MEPQQTSPINPIEATPPALSGASRFRPWLITVLAALAAAALAGGGVYGVMSKRSASERMALEQKISNLENQITKRTNVIDANPSVSTEDWITYKNEELGIQFSYPSSYEVETGRELNGIDKGKEISVWLTHRDLPGAFSLIATSRDYENGAGEGCCFYYSAEPFNITTASLGAISEKIKKLEPFDLKHVSVDNRNAVRFYSVKSYIDSWVVDSVLLPYKHGNFSNMMLSGPGLISVPNQRADGTWRELNDVKKELQESIHIGKHLQDQKISTASKIFDQILSTFKFLDTAPVSTADWKTFDQKGVRADVLPNFKFPRSWYTFDEDGGPFVEIHFSDGGNLINQNLGNKTIESRLYELSKPQENECRLSVGASAETDRYNINEYNSKINDNSRRACNMILSTLRKQIPKNRQIGGLW